MQTYILKKQQAAASISSTIPPAFSEPESQPEPIEDAPANGFMTHVVPPRRPVSEPEGLPDPINDAPELEPTAQLQALKELNGTLKRKLQEAVAVANGCHRALQREEAEADAETKKLRLHWQLERSAHLKTRNNPRNPTGASIFPTPEETQKFLADKERKARDAERERQRKIENDLKMALLSRYRIAVYEKQRAKKNQCVLVYGPLTKEATQRAAEIQKAAWAIARARGSKFAMLCDFQEAERSRSKNLQNLKVSLLY